MHWISISIVNAFAFTRAKPTVVKNVKRTLLGEKMGRIHMNPQNLDKMGGRRVSALRNTKKRPASEGGNSGSGKKARSS